MQEENVTIEQCECLHVHEALKNRILNEIPEEGKRILYALLCSEMCVCDLAQVLDMTQSAISHQLRTLKQMALVKNRRVGKTVFYSLSDSHISMILSQGMEHIEE